MISSQFSIYIVYIYVYQLLVIKILRVMKTRTHHHGGIINRIQNAKNKYSIKMSSKINSRRMDVYDF
jgi:hypothetical protein